LHQIDLAGRHVDLGPAVELDLQVLFDLPLLVQQLDSPIATDTVAQMDHQITGSQIEKAVDRFTRPPPTHSPDFAAGEQLVGRDDDYLLIRQAESVAEVPQREQEPLRGLPFRRPEDVAQPLRFGRRPADDEDLMSLSHVLQFVAHAAEFATEPLHGLDR